MVMGLQPVCYSRTINAHTSDCTFTGANKSWHLFYYFICLGFVRGCSYVVYVTLRSFAHMSRLILPLLLSCVNAQFLFIVAG